VQAASGRPGRRVDEVRGAQVVRDGGRELLLRPAVGGCVYSCCTGLAGYQAEVMRSREERGGRSQLGLAPRCLITFRSSALSSGENAADRLANRYIGCSTQ